MTSTYLTTEAAADAEARDIQRAEAFIRRVVSAHHYSYAAASNKHTRLILTALRATAKDAPDR